MHILDFVSSNVVKTWLFWELNLFPSFRGIWLIWNWSSYVYSIIIFYYWKYSFLEAECSCHEVETKTGNPNISGPLYWPKLRPWPNPVETTEYTSYNTCVVNESHFFGMVVIKFALLLLWLLCLHGKFVTMICDRVLFVASHTGIEWGPFSVVSSITLVSGLPWLWTQIAIMTTFLISLHLGYTG